MLTDRDAVVAAGARHAPPPDRRSSPASPARRSSSASSPPASTTTSTPRPGSPARWSPPTACREALGPVTIGEKAGEVFLGASLQELGSVGPATLELIDREVERIVGERSSRPTGSCERNWSAVYETANALIEHETLSGVALDARALDGPADPARLDGSSTGGARPRRRAAAGDGLTQRRRRAAHSRSPACVAAALSPRRRAGAPSRSGASSSRRRRPGAPFKVPLGAPGRPQVLGAQPRPADGRGQRRRSRAASTAGTAQSWHQLATVCGGPGRHGADRLGRARASSGWSASRACRAPAPGSALCRFKDGQVVGSWSTPIDAADPFRQMISAACNGAERLLVRRRRLAGRARRAGRRLPPALGRHRPGDASTARRGAAVSDMEFHRRRRSTRASLVGRAPENRTEPVDLAEPGARAAPDPPDRRRRLRQRPVRCRRRCHGVPADGTELLALDSDGTQTSGRSAAAPPPGPRRRPAGSVARPPLAARLVGGVFAGAGARPARPSAPTDRFGDVAAIPGTDDALGDGRALRRSPQRQQQGDGGADRARRERRP